MNIKKRIPKFLSLLLSFTIAFGNVIPAYAMENTNSDSTTVIDGENIKEDERNLEDITVTYKQASSFFVTIPKTIVLDGWKQSTYAVKVSGDIGAEQCVYVAPVDVIADTENIDFYMKDQAAENAKADIVASVTHNKSHWNSAEAAEGYEQTDNLVSAPDLTAGTWKGIFQMEIKLETHSSHTHNYIESITKNPTCTEDGERTYICDCGDSYTETIPATGHHYVDGECEHCGEKDPDAHEHSYIEKITKEPTCTEEGEKTYICDCGDSYTEKIPATGHSFVDGECEHCGEKDPDAHEHSYTEEITKQPTCTEDGEKTYTCGCGDSYTEKIPATGHNFVDGTCTNCGEEDPCSKSHTDEDGDDVCDICGHEHIWEENIDLIEWTRNSKSSSSSSVVQTGNTWKLNYKTTNQYTTVTLNGYMDITVPEDTEYTFNYASGFMWTNDRVRIYLDGELLVDFSNSSKSGTETVLLTAGEHTMQLTLNKQNTATTSTYASITLSPISIYNHKCSECEIKENHIYEEKVIKVPTCTEKGEKELTCTKCGYSYTEEVPSNGGPHIDENGDDVCDKCGHKHIWEDNVDTLEWIKNFNSSSIVKTGDQWKLYYDTSNQYTKYTLDGYWDITVPEDVEYSFDYRLSEWGSDSLAIYLDDTEIVNVSEDSSDSKTVTLTKGTHTIHAHFNKQSEWTGPYATITLNPIIALNHICTECGEKEAHHYAEGIVIKEPTCTEKGEKEFTCTKCGGTKTEEIDALGHNYVDGVCDRCGSLNLVKKRFWSAISSTSETEDTGGGHYDMATLSGAYSPNIEIIEDMRDGEYLLLDFYVKYPFYGGQGHYGEADGINGLSMLQKYNEETDTWETVYSYGLSYSTVGTNMAAQEGGYTFSPGNGIRRSFQLEKGTYRAYGRFSAGSGCGSSVAHHYYTYFISVDLCRVEKEAVETP